jgi:hypothetical protein
VAGLKLEKRMGLKRGLQKIEHGLSVKEIRLKMTFLEVLEFLDDGQVSEVKKFRPQRKGIESAISQG